MTQNDPKWPKYYPKMAQNGPRMTQNDPKWPKNDARIYALFPQFFLTEKAVPQTFSLLECMLTIFQWKYLRSFLFPLAIWWQDDK